MTDLFGAGGRRLLHTLELSGPYALRVQSLRHLLEVYDHEISMLDQDLSHQLAGNLGRRALEAIPGVGPVLATVFVAEVGDVTRFAGPHQLASWAGLTPKHKESDTTLRRGPITKQGSRLVRWAVVEAAQRQRFGSKLRSDFLRISASHGSGVGARPASRWPERSSPSSTTGCGTERSARLPERRRDLVGHRRARGR